MTLPPPGDYVAQLNGAIIVYESQSGSLCAAVPCAIADGEHTGFETKITVTLAKSDGTLMTKSIDNLKTVFGWDGLDPFWLADNAPAESRFTLAQCIHEEYEGKTFFKPGWLNAIGTSSMKMPEQGDRKSILAKYGSKFRAIAGGTAVKPKQQGLPGLPQAAPKLPAPKVLPKATMEQAWEAMNKSHPNLEQEDAEKLWFDTVNAMFPGKSNSDLTPQQWHQLVEKFTDNVPN